GVAAQGGHVAPNAFHAGAPQDRSRAGDAEEDLVGGIPAQVEDFAAHRDQAHVLVAVERSAGGDVHPFLGAGGREGFGGDDFAGADAVPALEVRVLGAGDDRREGGGFGHDVLERGEPVLGDAGAHGGGFEQEEAVGAAGIQRVAVEGQPGGAAGDVHLHQGGAGHDEPVGDDRVGEPHGVGAAAFHAQLGAPVVQAGPLAAGGDEQHRFRWAVHGQGVAHVVLPVGGTGGVGEVAGEVPVAVGAAAGVSGGADGGGADEVGFGEQLGLDVFGEER